MKTLFIRRGFSLVELLAAMAVLAILGLILSQITGSITRSTKQSTRIMDASAQARLAFDRIGFDFAGLVKRRDTDFVAQNLSTASPTSLLLFLSTVPASGIPTAENRGLSVVAYRVSVHADNKDREGTARACLLRSGKAIPWHPIGSTPASGFMGLQANGLPQTFASNSFPPALLPSNELDFDVLSPGVIRMIVGFQLYPDNKPVQLLNAAPPNPNVARGQIVYHPPTRLVTSNTGATVEYIDLNRVSAIIIGLVTVDGESLRLLNAAQTVLLGNAFATPTDSDNKTPVQAWTATANAVNALPATVPLPVRQSVRVYERTYPITPFTTQSP
ncbi:MAG: hypothetical protein B9S32_08200 [Verrucomicrobia bacterium Tous-C9LFEB]|nr:MAG: hypothetical protein B9S32_08200 [Verrucomicrobia bacterium Tous-C9LFEB]